MLIADHNEEEGAAAAAAARNEGYQAIFIPCDVRKEEDIVALIRATKEEYGTIHTLINNAGVSKWKSPYALTIAEWDDILNTNVCSCFIATREAAKVMKRNAEGGSVVNMTSTRAFMSEPDTEAYDQQHPSGRVGTAKDIARACLYLTQPGNDFVAGTNLVVDGGMTRKMIYEP